MNTSSPKDIEQRLIADGVHHGFARQASYGHVPAQGAFHEIRLSPGVLTEMIGSMVRFLDLAEDRRARISAFLDEEISRLIPERTAPNAYRLGSQLAALLRDAFTPGRGYIGTITLHRRNVARARIDAQWMDVSENMIDAVVESIGKPDNDRIFGRALAQYVWDRCLSRHGDVPAWTDLSAMQREPLINVGQAVFRFLGKIMEPKFPVPAALLRLPKDLDFDVSGNASHREDPMAHYPAWVSDMRRQEALAVLSRPEHRDRLERISKCLPSPSVAMPFALPLSSLLHQRRRDLVSDRIVQELNAGPDHVFERIEAVGAAASRLPPILVCFPNPTRDAFDASRQDPQAQQALMVSDFTLLSRVARDEGPGAIAELAGFGAGADKKPDLKRLFVAGLFLNGSVITQALSGHLKNMPGTHTDQDRFRGPVMKCLCDAYRAADVNMPDEAEILYVQALDRALRKRAFYSDRPKLILDDLCRAARNP